MFCFYNNVGFCKVQNGNSEKPPREWVFRGRGVIRTRFERVTVCLEGRCSIQLSYRTKNQERPWALLKYFWAY